MVAWLASKFSIAQWQWTLYLCYLIPDAGLPPSQQKRMHLLSFVHNYFAAGFGTKSLDLNEHKNEDEVISVLCRRDRYLLSSRSREEAHHKVIGTDFPEDEPVLFLIFCQARVD